MLLSLLIILAAFAGSILAGLFGGGAGLIFTPTIFLFLSYKNPHADHLMQTSITTMITAMLVSGLVSCFKQHKYKQIDWSAVRWSIVPIVIGALIGCVVMMFVSSKNLTYFFAIITLLLSVRYIFKLYQQPKNIVLSENNTGNLFKYVGSFILGIISTVSGSASFAVPFYEYAGLGIKSAIGTTTITVWVYSVFVVITMIVSGIGQSNLPAGNIGFLNYSSLLLFMLPTIPGAMLGAKLSHFLPEKTLKIGFTILLVVIGVTMLLV